MITLALATTGILLQQSMCQNEGCNLLRGSSTKTNIHPRAHSRSQISNKDDKNTLKRQLTLQITVQKETGEPNDLLIFKGTVVQLSATDADIAL
jgi:hypothetical protein